MFSFLYKRIGDKSFQIDFSDLAGITRKRMDFFRYIGDSIIYFPDLQWNSLNSIGVGKFTEA